MAETGLEVQIKRFDEMVFERSDVGSLPRLFEMCFHGGVDQGRKAWQDVDQVQGHFEGHDGCVWGAWFGRA